jgi:penicillin-binding protein 1A
MKSVHVGLEPLPFEVPEGVALIPVCKESGLRPTQYCPETVQEVFISGKEPARPCDRHLPSEASLFSSGSEFRELDRQSQEEGLPEPE